MQSSRGILEVREAGCTSFHDVHAVIFDWRVV
jgi:hypothetical protein